LFSNLKTARRFICKNVANIHLGADIRRGVPSWTAKAKTVGGIVVMRYGENALNVIDGVKRR